MTRKHLGIFCRQKSPDHPNDVEENPASSLILSSSYLIVGCISVEMISHRKFDVRLFSPTLRVQHLALGCGFKIRIGS